MAALLAISLFMALPPRSDAQLQDAELIVVGTVRAVRHEEVRVPGGTDHLYTATVDVARVEKALLPGALGKSIQVRYRQTGSRPPGWAGPQGQNALLQVGATVRLFLRSTSDGLELLEPNGWQPAR